MRLTTRFDYAIDVCKDYKETGNCGFGDNCVFLHDRGDYKTGWQIDLEWEKAERERKRQAELDAFVLENRGDEVVDDEAEDSFEYFLILIPHRCLACGCELKDPVMAKCEHVVCEACALKNASQCSVCDEPTNGTFTVAKKVGQLMKEKKARLDEKEREIRQRVGPDPNLQEEEN